MAPKIQAIVWFLEAGGKAGSDHKPGEYWPGDARRDRDLDRAGQCLIIGCDGSLWVRAAVVKFF